MNSQPRPLVDILMDIRALIDKPEKWTQGVGARDKRGVEIDGEGGRR